MWSSLEALSPLLTLLVGATIPVVTQALNNRHQRRAQLEQWAHEDNRRESEQAQAVTLAQLQAQEEMRREGLLRLQKVYADGVEALIALAHELRAVSARLEAAKPKMPQLVNQDILAQYARAMALLRLELRDTGYASRLDEVSACVDAAIKAVGSASASSSAAAHDAVESLMAICQDLPENYAQRSAEIATGL